MATSTAVTKSAFKTEYMQPFVDSLRNFFEKHLALELSIGKLTLNATSRPPFPIAGVITFSGSVVGRAVISLPNDVATSICGAYLKMDPLPDGVVEDCVGEIANVIVGRAKSDLSKFNIVISPPTVVVGASFSIAPQRGAACLSIPCECTFGALQLDISMVQPG